MRHLVKIVLILSIFQLGSPVIAAESNDNELVQMFAWWNAAIKDQNGLTEEAFRRYYTEDAAIIINSKERVRGIKNLVTHFKNIQQKVESVEIVLPFEEGFKSGNRIFTYHKVRRRVDGVDGESHIMGYAIVEDGKIALADFISYQPPGSETSPAH